MLGATPCWTRGEQLDGQKDIGHKPAAVSSLPTQHEESLSDVLVRSFPPLSMSSVISKFPPSCPRGPYHPSKACLPGSLQKFAQHPRSLGNGGRQTRFATLPVRWENDGVSIRRWRQGGGPWTSGDGRRLTRQAPIPVPSLFRSRGGPPWPPHQGCRTPRRQRWLTEGHLLVVSHSRGS